MRTVICARGIGERPGTTTMLTDVTRRLDPTRFRIKELPYSAAYGTVGGNEAFAVSQTQGRNALLSMIRDDPYPVVLLGFSAGAKLVGDVAAEIAAGMHDNLGLVVDAVGLIADPARHSGQIVGDNRGGHGITGNRWIDPKRFPVWQFSAPGDPISELPVGNPLRTFADLTEFWGPDQGRWMQELADRARKRQWQRWWDLNNWQSWGGAIYWAQNYLFRQRHIRYAVENMVGENVTYTARLAQMIGGLS